MTEIKSTFVSSFEMDKNFHRKIVKQAFSKVYYYLKQLNTNIRME